MKKALVAIFLTLTTGVHAQLFSVGTDVAMDALMAPNLGFELNVGKRSTVSINALYTKNPWYSKDKLKGWAVQPEYRYYIANRLMHGLFIGVAGIGAIYDVTWAGKRYDGHGIGGGITYGYVWKITSRLNLDFHSSFGAIYYRRKEYFKNDNFDVDYSVDGNQMANAKGYYLLPVRMGISLTLLVDNLFKRKEK